MITPDKIIDEMVDIMPFELSENVRPYIIEALEIYAKRKIEEEIKDIKHFLVDSGHSELAIKIN